MPDRSGLALKAKSALNVELNIGIQDPDDTDLGIGCEVWPNRSTHGSTPNY